MSGYVQVGKVKDAHGIKGEIFVVLFSGEAAWLDQLNEIRLIDGGSDTKIFSLKSARPHKNGLILRSSEILDRNQAESLIGALLEVPEEFFVSKKGETIYLREVSGFRVFEKEKGEVGVVVGFSHNGAQDLLVVRTQTGEFEIPFVKELVETIDYDGRCLYMQLPLGLLGELDNEDDEDVGGSSLE